MLSEELLKNAHAVIKKMKAGGGADPDPLWKVQVAICFGLVLWGKRLLVPAAYQGIGPTNLFFRAPPQQGGQGKGSVRLRRTRGASWALPAPSLSCSSCGVPGRKPRSSTRSRQPHISTSPPTARKTCQCRSCDKLSSLRHRGQASPAPARIPRAVLAKAERALQKCADELQRCETFHDLYRVVLREPSKPDVSLAPRRG